jgi:catechol 2,3-dioxygenase-like lactoylglutathione lyase family enzyme
MLDAMSHVGVWVRDQDEAKAFYSEKLGFEVREDATLDEFGGYRWLTVGPPGQPELNLILSRPGPPAVDPEGAEQVLALVARGRSAAASFAPATAARRAGSSRRVGSSWRSSPKSASTASMRRSATPRATSGASSSRSSSIPPSFGADPPPATGSTPT